jgi:hypothetical protein
MPTSPQEIVQPPGDHDARDPEPRAHLLHGQVAGHFEQHVGDEEQTAADAESRGGEAEVLVHGERGEADVHAIHVGDEVAQNQKRDQAKAHRPHGFAFKDGDIRGLRGWRA